MFLRKKQIYFSRLWTRLIAGCFFIVYSVQADPTELPLNERNAFEEKKAVIRNQSSVLGESMFPKKMSSLNTDTVPLRNSSILKQRISVQMSDEFRDRKLDSMLHRFSVLFEDELDESNSPSSSVHSGFLKNVAFGTSGWVERKGMWKAHLQRTDFALLAEKMSLNDINRFQFRKNRRNGEDLPIKPAGGNLTPYIDHDEN